MNEREALQLVKQLLDEALQQRPLPTTYVRDLAGQIGDLRATIRAALVVIDTAGVEK